MQLLPPPIEPIAPHCRIHIAVMFAVELVAKPAVVLVSFTNMLQFARYEFQDNDVVEIADDRNIIRKDIFRVAEIYECGQDAFTVGRRQPPFDIGKHLQHGFEFRQPRRHEVGQWFALANIVDNATYGIDDFGLIRAVHDGAGFFQRVTKKPQVTIAEFER